MGNLPIGKQILRRMCDVVVGECGHGVVTVVIVGLIADIDRSVRAGGGFGEVFG